MSQEVVRVQKAAHHWTYVQCALMKFQASACPATFLAMELMVGPTSIRRIFSGSKVYSRYLRDKEGASLCKKIVAGIHLIRGASTQTRVVVHARQWRKNNPRLCVSPVEQPDLLGAGQSLAELVPLRGVGGALKLVPGKVPLFPPAGGQGLAVDHRAQDGGDAEPRTRRHTHTRVISPSIPSLKAKFLSS